MGIDSESAESVNRKVVSPSIRCPKSAGMSDFINLATVANQGGNTPDLNTADWSLMAQAGVTGPAGAAGAQGSQGPQGNTGVTGAQGPIGPTGATGAQGPLGIQGVAGPQGPAGVSSGSSGISTTTTTLGASYVVITSTSKVPTGTYYVSAATTVLATADAEVTCILTNSANDSDKTSSVALGPAEVTISNLSVFTVTGTDLFELQCNVTGNNTFVGQVLNSKITAILINNAN
jgi:hypothetical protein